MPRNRRAPGNLDGDITRRSDRPLQPCYGEPGAQGVRIKAAEDEVHRAMSDLGFAGRSLVQNPIGYNATMIDDWEETCAAHMQNVNQAQKRFREALGRIRHYARNKENLP